jgi:hypothetical protein
LVGWKMSSGALRPKTDELTAIGSASLRHRHLHTLHHFRGVLIALEAARGQAILVTENTRDSRTQPCRGRESASTTWNV